MLISYLLAMLRAVCMSFVVNVCEPLFTVHLVACFIASTPYVSSAIRIASSAFFET